MWRLARATSCPRRGSSGSRLQAAASLLQGQQPQQCHEGVAPAAAQYRASHHSSSYCCPLHSFASSLRPPTQRGPWGRRSTSSVALLSPSRHSLQRPHQQQQVRSKSASAAAEADDDDAGHPLDKHMQATRNIGISAHIDSGKTTLTERILFYTGRIGSIHDVRGKDGVGAKMDSMDLEREKGITIQSAATFCEWGDKHINIIDTPGHVDFTIEVERALRVLDGAILVLCGVSGVQSQSLTVDRQMKRYNVPRLAFVNKLDRSGASPSKVIGDLRSQLRLNAAAVQLPMGLEDRHQGVIDIIDMRSFSFEGEKGETVTEGPVPEEYQQEALTARQEVIERVADVDEEIGELFLMEEEIDTDTLKAAIRRATIACKFCPVFMGSAFKNKGVQPLLDGVIDYLPCPEEVPNFALDTTAGEAQVPVVCSSDAPLLALAFKLEEGQYGQLTYMRIYQGTISKGCTITNLNTGKSVKVPRVVRMHSNEMQEVDRCGAGDVIAMFGVDCSSMDSFTDGTHNLAMTSMYVPEAVMSLAVKPDKDANLDNFGKALQKFTREDPTLRIHTDLDTKETIMSGMGELHLDVYVERLKREYNVNVVVGAPKVNYREAINKKASFTYLHKKQTGGSGQYAKVIGFIEPLDINAKDDNGAPVTHEFENHCVGMNIPPEYITSCMKGFDDARLEGGLLGKEVHGLRVVLQDGAAHAVDSSDMAFRFASAAAVRTAMVQANPAVLEPMMMVEITAPVDFQGGIVGGINKRMGVMHGVDVSEDGSSCCIKAEVPLAQMFGYSTDLRSGTQGKGEYTMEYSKHQQVNRDLQVKLVKEHREALEEEAASK